MTRGKFSRTLLVAAFALVSLFCSGAAAQPAAQTPGYDTVIVPGERIGPVAMGGSVNRIVELLGRPSRQSRSGFRGPGYTADQVTYVYRGRQCIQFTWFDSGLDPKVGYGFIGIIATCDTWRTAEGVHVGMTIPEAIRLMGAPESTTNCGGRSACVLCYQRGLFVEARNRNSPISAIKVVNRNTETCSGD